MSTLLIRNISHLVTCDDADRVLQNVDLYCENGLIKSIGQNLDVTADETIDGSHMLCYPGLVNTPHHLYQVFSRNLPKVQKKNDKGEPVFNDKKEPVMVEQTTELEGGRVKVTLPGFGRLVYRW